MIADHRHYLSVFEVVSAYGSVGLSLGIPNVRSIFARSVVSHMSTGKLLFLRFIPTTVEAHYLSSHDTRSSSWSARGN